MKQHNHGIVKPPDLPHQGARRKDRGPELPLGCKPQGPAKRDPSPVRLPDHRFSAKDSKMPQPPSAVEPGKGSIPVAPFTVEGSPARAEPDADDVFPRPVAR